MAREENYNMVRVKAQNRQGLRFVWFPAKVGTFRATLNAR